MDERARAEEHLRIIRSLMERATVYRAISAPSALCAGLLALTIGSTSRWWEVGDNHRYGIVVWLGVLIVAGLVNTWFLWRDSRRRGEPFFSSGMKLALRALAPAFLVAGVLTAMSPPSALALLVLLWAVCYGIALLSTGHFAPSSINWLGRAFLITGLLTTVVLFNSNLSFSEEFNSAFPNFFMAGTFGLFHVIYALCTWPSRKVETSQPA